MKIKLCIVLLLITSNLFSWSFDFFDSEKISQLKNEIKKDNKNANLHVKLAKEYAIEFDKSNDIDDLEDSYNEIKIAHSLQPMNLQIIQMNYFVGEKLVRQKKDEKLLKELEPLFKILNTSNINAAPISYIKSMILPYNKTTYLTHIELLKKAISLNNKFVDSYFQLTIAYQDSKKYDLAIYTAKLGKKIKPNFHGFYYLQARSMMEKIAKHEKESNCQFLNKEESEKIIKLLKKAIKLNPNIINAKYELALQYARIGKTKLAIFIKKQILKNNPEDPDALMQLAYSYSRDLQFKKAIEILKNISTNNKDINNIINSELAQIYVIIQNWKEANKYFEKSINKNKQNNFYDFLNFNITKSFLDNSNNYKDLNNLPSFISVSDWNKNIKQFLQKEIDESKLLHLATNKCKKTEALYYIGLNNIIDGKSSEAKSCFKKIVDLKIYSYTEYVSSKYYLQNIDKN